MLTKNSTCGTFVKPTVCNVLTWHREPFQHSCNISEYVGACLQVLIALELLFPLLKNIGILMQLAASQDMVQCTSKCIMNDFKLMLSSSQGAETPFFFLPLLAFQRGPSQKAPVRLSLKQETNHTIDGCRDWRFNSQQWSRKKLSGSRRLNKPYLHYSVQVGGHCEG